MLKQFKPALLMLAVLTLVTGLVYPLLVTAVAQGLFPRQADGSLIELDGKVVGSQLIGQAFTDPKYFWSRPSATSPMSYNAASSSGSNLGPTNPALEEAVQVRIQALKDSDPGNTAPIPVDLVTSSASGLDPHISPAAAYWQAGRVARARGLSVDRVRALISKQAEGRQLGFLGEPRVAVLTLNLALDHLSRP